MTVLRPRHAILGPALTLLLAACSPAEDQSARTPTPTLATPAATQPETSASAAIRPVDPIEAQAPGAAVPTSAPAPTPSQAGAPADPSTSPAPAAAQAINQATFSAAGLSAGGDAARDILIRAEVLLDRAGFSPGVIDGRPGGNLKGAIGAWQAAHGLPVDGQLTAAVWDGITRADPAPAAAAYVITSDDTKGPFIGSVPKDMEAMAKLDHLGFTSPTQLLAEKFHMDQRLLAALNPGADLGVAGTALVVTAPGAGTAATVSRVEVDKSARQVRALGADGRLVAAFPATVGSSERPAPSGNWAVRDIARNPNYTFDPTRLTFGKSDHKLTIPAGPNNPVGSTWIGLTKETYGIHGAPDPTKVGKVASHGCVRLTNWDARRLASMVKKGTPVVFVGQAAS
jgi:lipoprotein-anchoring transpeptidase ErfK/SrfK